MKDREEDSVRRMVEETAPPPYNLVWPEKQSAPIVISSPHSGAYYPPELVAGSALDALTLRRSEDCFVGELYAEAPKLGLPLITANYARAYVDCNRDAFELDPAMFSDRLPAYVDRNSTGVLTGFGTVPRRVTPDHEIYERPLSFAAARNRIERIYRPYHRALADALDRTFQVFGCAFLIDAHSMPTLTVAPGDQPATVVLGDRFGDTAPRFFVDGVERFLMGQGLKVARNVPYAGGFITRHYHRPEVRIHSLQIEIDRALYMDQDRLRKTAEFTAMQSVITQLLGNMIDWTSLWTATDRAAE